MTDENDTTPASAPASPEKIRRAVVAEDEAGNFTIEYESTIPQRLGLGIALESIS